MSSASDAEDLTFNFLSEIVEELYGQVHSELIAQTNNRAARVERVYNQFFALISSHMMNHSGDEDVAPSIISGFMGGEGQWQSLSLDWQSQKEKAKVGTDYYQGLTWAKGGMVKRLGGTSMVKNVRGQLIRAGATREKSLKRASKSASMDFQTFIDTRESQGKAYVDKIFGPLGIDYTFKKDGKVMTTTKDGDQLKRIYTHQPVGGKGRYQSLPNVFEMTSTITAFEALKGVSFSEWYIVDFILKRRDPANEKQWVKINSRYGFSRGHRPIRAMIAPLISWYINRGFADALKGL